MKQTKLDWTCKCADDPQMPASRDHCPICKASRPKCGEPSKET